MAYGQRASRFRTWVKLVPVAAIVVVGATQLHRKPTVRIATFNIENYGAQDKRTDDRRLIELLRTLDADVIAVQEIQDTTRFGVLVADVHAKGRRYCFHPSDCGGKGNLHVGFIVDERRVHLVETREFRELNPGGEGRCSLGERPGLLGTFSSDAGKFDMLVMHLVAFPGRFRQRQEQWEDALEIVRRRPDAQRPIAIVGDMNSTGFLEDENGERSFIEEHLATAGMKLLTASLGCSTYFDPRNGTRVRRSLLDHVAVSANFPIRGGATLLGYCREVGCRAELANTPPDFDDVSDHCPVSVGER